MSVQAHHVRKSKTVLDSGFHDDCIADSRYWIPVFVSGTWNPDSVSAIPDSLSYIPDYKTQDFRFHKETFPRFRIPKVKISQISESEFHSTCCDCNPRTQTC